MRFTLEQDYSVRIIYELCRNENKRLDVGELSELTGVTPLFIQKIMRKLTAAGLVESKKGVRGGYTLAENRNMSNISLADVFSAIEGDICINSCLGDSYTCTRPEVIENGGECCIKKAIRMLNDNLTEALRSVSFEKIINNKETN